MQSISVPLQNRSYPIWIENGLLAKLPELLKPMNQNQKWVIFSQNEIISLYGNNLRESLKSARFQIELVVLPDGEKAKSLSTLEGIFSQLMEMGCDRSSTFLALEASRSRRSRSPADAAARHRSPMAASTSSAST